MLYYSDCILSKRPWSYCRLDDSVDAVIYLDQTGNSNHLHAKREMVDSEWVYTLSAQNQRPNPITGDFNPLSVQIIWNPTIFINGINWEQPLVYNLSWDIPLFLSEIVFYNRGVKIQNPIQMKHLWMEFVLIDFNPIIQFTQFDSVLSTIFGSDASKMVLDEMIVDVEGFHGLSGERCDAELSVSYSYEISDLQFTLGPISVFANTLCRYDFTGFPIYQKLDLEFYIGETKVHSIPLKDREWDGSTYITTESTVFSGARRFTIGVSQEQPGSMTFYLSINGAAPTTQSIETTQVLSQAYRRTGFVGNMNISHVSLFFNTPFPSAEWLNNTQNMIEYNKSIQHIETRPVRFIIEDTSFPKIENIPGSFGAFLNSAAFIGSKHNTIQSFSVIQSPIRFDIPLEDITPGNPSLALNEGITINDNRQFLSLGLWKVLWRNSTTVLLVPSETARNNLFFIENGMENGSEYHAKNVMGISGRISIVPRNSHIFRVDEIVIIDFIKPSGTTYGNEWSVSFIGAEHFTITYTGPSSGILESDNLIIKKVGLGGSRVWEKEWVDDSRFLLNSVPLSSSHCKLLCDDTLSDIYAQFNLFDPETENTSKPAYFLKNIKPELTKPKNNDFSIFGDPYRFYLFVSSKNTSVSHSQVLCYGDISDILILDNYETFLIGFNKNTILTESNYTFAFEYPHWSILDSGHLLCQSDEYNRKSDTRSSYMGSNTINISDSGFHVFPDNYQYIVDFRFIQEQGMGEYSRVQSYYGDHSYYTLTENIQIQKHSQLGTIWYGNITAPDSDEIEFIDKLRYLGSMAYLFRIGTRRIPVASITRNVNYGYRWIITTEEPHNLMSGSFFERILGSTRGTTYDNYDILSGTTGYYYGNTKRYAESIISATSFTIINNINDSTPTPDPFEYDSGSGYDGLYITVPVFLSSTQDILEKTGPDISGNSVYRVVLQSTGMIDDANCDIRIRTGQISTFTYF